MNEIKIELIVRKTEDGSYHALAEFPEVTTCYAETDLLVTTMIDISAELIKIFYQDPEFQDFTYKK